MSYLENFSFLQNTLSISTKTCNSTAIVFARVNLFENFLLLNNFFTNYVF